MYCAGHEQNKADKAYVGMLHSLSPSHSRGNSAIAEIR